MYYAWLMGTSPQILLKDRDPNAVVEAVQAFMADRP